MSVLLTAFAKDRLQAQSQVQHYASIPECQVNGICSNKEGELLIATGYGIYASRGYDEPALLLTEGEVNFIHEIDSFVFYMQGENLKITTRKKLLNKENSIVTKPLKNNTGNNRSRDLSTALVVTSMAYIPAFRELWIGTKGDGLIKINQSRTSTLWEVSYVNNVSKKRKNDSGLTSADINALYVDKRSNLWIGTANGMCIRHAEWTEKKSESGKWTYSMKDNHITAIAGNQKRVWVASKTPGSRRQIHALAPISDDQRVVYDPDPRVIPLDSVFNLRDIYDLSIDKTGDLWIGGMVVGRIKGLGNIHSDSSLYPQNSRLWKPQIYDQRAGFNSVQALHIKPDGLGKIWIGTGGRGVYIIKKNPVARFTDVKTVECHGQRNGAFTIEIIDGQPPFQVFWRSKNNKNGQKMGISKNIPFTNLTIDTFHFTIIDALAEDTSTIDFTVKGPPLMEAYLKTYKIPTYEDSHDGVVRVEGLRGGNIDPTKIGGENHQGYTFNWSTNDKPCHFSEHNYLPLGEYAVTISDTTRNCTITLRGIFEHPEHPFKERTAKEYYPKDFILWGIFFEDRTLNIKKEAFEKLDDFIDYMLYIDPTMKIMLEGYVNSKCTYDCMNLSYNRAVTVKEYMQRKGIHDNRISVKGRGTVRLAYNNDEQNNYVKLTVTKAKKRD